MKSVFLAILTLMSLSVSAQIDFKVCPGGVCPNEARAMQECNLGHDGKYRPGNFYYISRSDSDPKRGKYELDCFDKLTGAVAFVLTFTEEDGGNKLSASKIRSASTASVSNSSTASTDRPSREAPERPSRSTSSNCAKNDADKLFADCHFKEVNNANSSLVCQNEEYVRYKVVSSINAITVEKSSGVMSKVKDACDRSGGDFSYQNDQNFCSCPAGRLKYNFECSTTGDEEVGNAKKQSYHYPNCSVRNSQRTAFLKNCLLSTDKEYISCPNTFYKRKDNPTRINDERRDGTGKPVEQNGDRPSRTEGSAVTI